MSNFVFYKPAPRWQICAAIAASVAIHLAAVGAANTKVVAADGATEVPFDDPTVEATDQTPAEPTPPPEDIPLPPSPPPIDESLFTDATPPSPVPQRSAPRTPIVRRASIGASAPASMSAAKVAAISAPRPDYPYEARRQHATGSGVATLYVDPASGVVTSVAMTQSTGNVILDNATVSAFRHWRFKPATVSVVRTPITFTLTGVQF